MYGILTLRSLDELSKRPKATHENKTKKKKINETYTQIWGKKREKNQIKMKWSENELAERFGFWKSFEINFYSRNKRGGSCFESVVCMCLCLYLLKTSEKTKISPSSLVIHMKFSCRAQKCSIHKYKQSNYQKENTTKFCNNNNNNKYINSNNTKPIDDNVNISMWNRKPSTQPNLFDGNITNIKWSDSLNSNLLLLDICILKEDQLSKQLSSERNNKRTKQNSTKQRVSSLTKKQKRIRKKEDEENTKSQPGARRNCSE